MNSFNPELRLKNTEFAIRHELVDLLKGFKFMATLVLEFKKIDKDDKTKFSSVYSNSKADINIDEVILIMYLNQSITSLYQTYKNP